MAFVKGQSGNPKGRPAGVPNRATADIKALALEYAPDAMKKLFDIAMKSDSDAASVSAIKELLDRGFGKATQSSDVNLNGKLEQTVNEIRRTIIDPAKPE